MNVHSIGIADQKNCKDFKKFSATFPADGTSLQYWIEYGDFGGQNSEDKASGHTAKDSFLVLDDAAGKRIKTKLIDNSGSAHFAKNLRFSDSCPMKAMPMQNCQLTMYYHNLAGGDDRDFKNHRQFTAPFPADGSALNYWIKYTDPGGQNKEDKASGHTYKDSTFVFDDATGKRNEIKLVDNSGSAHDIVQGEGGEQGDPLMPALFSLGMAS